MFKQNKRLVIIALFTAILLLIPFISMRYTDEVNWTLSDFIVAGILLIGSGLIGEMALRKTENIWFRIAIILSLLVILFLSWAELAVGIFGTPLGGH